MIPRISAPTNSTMPPSSRAMRRQVQPLRRGVGGGSGGRRRLRGALMVRFDLRPDVADIVVTGTENGQAFTVEWATKGEAKKMKAITIHAFGGPEVLTLEDLP